MNVMTVAGGWYGRNLVGGEFACLVIGSHIASTYGDVPLPVSEKPDDKGPQNALYLEATSLNDAFYLACVGNKDDFAWFWTGAEWRNTGVKGAGMKPVAFNGQDLYVATGQVIEVFNIPDLTHRGTLPISTGSGGIQHVRPDGTVVTGDANYAGPTLSQWTQIGDVTVGQSYDGDKAIIEYDRERYLLDPDECKWIKLDRDREDLAITCVKQAAGKTDFYWLTAAEIPMLPLDSQAPSPPPPPTGETIPVPALAALPNKLLWVPHYTHDDRYGDSPIEDGTYNAILLPEREAQTGGGVIDFSVLDRELARVVALRPTMPLVVDAGQRQPAAQYLDRTVAYWVGKWNYADLEASVRRALTFAEKPIIAYNDRPQEWPEQKPDWITSQVWPSVQAYRNKDESLADFKRRIEVWLDRMAAWCPYFALAPAFYTRNGAVSVSHVLECMPLYDEWLRRYSIVAVEPFAANRLTGMKQHQPLLAWCQAFMRANPGRPNRYDYWEPATVDVDTVLKNKLGQDERLPVTLTNAQRRRLLDGLAALNGHDDPDDDDEDDPDPGEYKSQAPDVTPVLRQLAAEHPVEWAEAYEYDGHPRTDRFVRLAAGHLHRHVDPRFGLNGKRGTDTLSLDVFAFKNPTVPAICGSVELIDFIRDNGRPGENEVHEFQWSDATIVPGMRPDLPDGVKGKWIQP